MTDGSSLADLQPTPLTAILLIAKGYPMEDTMAGLLVKNLPKHIHLRLKERAALNRRSMSAEVIVMLERILDDRAGPSTLEGIDRLRVKGATPLTQELLDEARDRGRR